MKPNLFRLIKHGSILTWKVTAIVGVGLIGIMHRVLGSEAEIQDDSEEPAMYSMDPARGLDPLNYFGVLHEKD